MTRKDITPKTGTLVGPRSFKAHVTHRSSGEVHGFDAHECVSVHAQRELFKDYTDTAKSLGYKTAAGAHNPAGGNWGSAPKFTAAPFSKVERQWLGREVSFTVHDVYKIELDEKLSGFVWSLASSPRHFWVYVEGRGFFSVHEDNLHAGFYSVRMDDLLMGVNA